jgi:hypothetical protein
MPSFQILSPEQLAERDTKPKGRSGRRRNPERTRVIEEYKEQLQNVEPGYGVEVSLGEEEDKRIVRQNLKVAAQELGVAFEFRPIKDKSRIHFRVLTTEEAATRPKRGGRPRKNAQQ